MKDYEKEQWYDHICYVLTEFKEGNIDIDELYPLLVDIVNSWEELVA